MARGNAKIARRAIDTMIDTATVTRPAYGARRACQWDTLSSELPDHWIGEQRILNLDDHQPRVFPLVG